ncbi:MAG: hypothetical protein KA968_14705, partial [Chitinophagaceae bacterium]|nr:hypothetical protein [Chitinophagaceae bacterium]
ATTVHGHNSYLEGWDGSTWVSIVGIKGKGDGFGGVNDTDWHQIRVAGIVGCKFVRLAFESKSTIDFDSYDIQIARVGVFEGIWESSEHILPEAWFSPHIDYHSSIKTSTTSDILAVPENTWVEWNAYKKTYYTSLPVTASWIGSGTLTIPDFNYIYNIKIMPSYCPTVSVPTEPPTAVPAWYAYWTQSGAQNFNGSSNTVNVYFPAPTGTENVTIEVDYWPADIPDADLP